jgi:hypothetical protein
MGDKGRVSNLNWEPMSCFVRVNVNKGKKIPLFYKIRQRNKVSYYFCLKNKLAGKIGL